MSKPTCTTASGDRFWLVDGVGHREDGPAVECADGRVEYWVRGQMHRDDGPALTYPSGQEAWMRRGRLHRDDGPAVTYPDGSTMWAVNGHPIAASDAKKISALEPQARDDVSVLYTEGANVDELIQAVVDART